MLFQKKDYTFLLKSTYVSIKKYVLFSEPLIHSIQTTPHHHENNNDYPPSQAKELAEKQTKNPDFTRTFRKKLYICGAFAKQQCRL